MFAYSKDRFKNRPVISLQAAYGSFCANEYKYYDEFVATKDYWMSVHDCGKEGRLDDGMLEVFDTIVTKKFFAANNVHDLGRLFNIKNFANEEIASLSKSINLGFMPKIILDKKIPGCSIVQKNLG